MKKILLLFFTLLFSVFGFSQIDLGPNVETCASEYIIETDNSGTNYIWSLDGAVITGEIVSYITVTQSGEYTVTVTIGGADYSDSVTVNFLDTPVANEPSDFVLCDQDGSGNVTVQLSIKDVEILGNLPQTDYYVAYYLTEQDALSQTNALTDPFTTTTNPQTIFAVIVSVADNCVSNVVGFDIIANPSPIVYPSEAFACDELGNGIGTFDLTQYDNSFLQGNANYVVSYYETEADAQAGMNAIVGAYTNIVAYAQVLYVKVEDITTGCSSFTELYLNVVDGVQSIAPTPLIAPDPDNDGFAAFNLVDKDNEITGEDTNLQVSYHETLTDAQNNVNPLPSPYFNIVVAPQTVFVRIESAIISTDCASFEELVLQTEYAPFVVNEATLAVCDNDNDGFEIYDLTSAEATILDGLNAADYSMSYYNSYDDAQMQTNPITDPNNYTNIVSPQLVYVGVQEIGTTNYVITTINLDFGSAPYLNLDSSLVLCDGQSLALNPNGNPNDIYLWSTDETTPSIVITSPGEYSVTVIDAITGCENSGLVTVELGVLPAITQPIDLITCDTLGTFDLTSVIPQMLNGTDPSSVTILFHITLADAQNGTNPLANPNIYTANVALETIYVNVYTNDGGCSVVTDFNLISENCPTIITCGTPQTIETCYENNETQQYTFTSSDGSPLIVAFNSGMVENNWDELIVLDSDGVTNLNAANPYGNDGDLSGLAFESTGDTITVYIQSDFIIIGCTDEEPINFDVFCSGDTVGIIKVNAFLDLNNDGVFNGADTPFTNGFFTYEMNNDGSPTIVNSTYGGFNIFSYDDANTYDITLSTNAGYESCYTISTALFEAISVTIGNTVFIDFPVTEQSQCEDLAVYLIPSASPRPGFDYYNYLVIENEGFSTIDSGTVTFINDPQVSYLGASYASSDVTITPNANGLTMDFVDLAPGETKSVWIEMNVPASINLGEFLTNTATYTTAANDIVVDNNTSVLSQEVIGSYDPNDIAESHGPEIVYEDFITTNEYLYYTVRFQNIGTAEAINVRIENTINPLLDINTLEVLHASHSEVLKVIDSQLIWYFDDINLPAESQDADGSNGYVYYRIKPTAGYALGTIIPNTAEIYFDFNAAVITNTFTTEFVAPVLSVEEFELNNTTFTLSPNPADHTVNITLPSSLNADANIIVYNIQGKRLMTKGFEKNTLDLQLNVENLQSGLYFVNLKTNTNETIKRLVVK
jgi:hypothetical protein